MIGKIIGFIIAIVFLIFMLIMGIVGMILERKDFNEGICPRCGGKLEHFDTDSQGGRGYHCPECGKYYTWVSWGWVDKKYRKQKEHDYYAEDGYGDRYGRPLK